MLPKTFSELEDVDEEKIINEYKNNNSGGDKLANFKAAMDKIDVSKLFNNSNMPTLESLKEKYFGNISNYDSKLVELDKALSLVTEQLEKNPVEAKAILEKELKKAKRLQKELKTEITRIPESKVDLATILNKIK